MYTSGLSGVDPTSSAWNAIASIKSTSPFADASSGSSDVAGEFDSLIDTSASDALQGSSTSASAGAASAAGSGSASSSQLALLRQMQNAEQSTIDLYA